MESSWLLPPPPIPGVRDTQRSIARVRPIREGNNNPLSTKYQRQIIVEEEEKVKFYICHPPFLLESEQEKEYYRAGWKIWKHRNREQEAFLRQIQKDADSGSTSNHSSRAARGRRARRGRGGRPATAGAARKRSSNENKKKQIMKSETSSSSSNVASGDSPPVVVLTPLSTSPQSPSQLGPASTRRREPVNNADAKVTHIADTTIFPDNDNASDNDSDLVIKQPRVTSPPTARATSDPASVHSQKSESKNKAAVEEPSSDNASENATNSSSVVVVRPQRRSVLDIVPAAKKRMRNKR